MPSSQRVKIFIASFWLFFTGVFFCQFNALAAECTSNAEYTRTCADKTCTNAGSEYTPKPELTCSDNRTCCETKKIVLPSDESTCKKEPGGRCSEGDSCKSGEQKRGICGKRSTGLGLIDIPCCVTSTNTPENCTKSGGRCSTSSDCASDEKINGSCGERSTGIAGLQYACCIKNDPGTQQTPTTGGGTFSPLEKIPFLDETNPSFPTYVKAIYNFAIWSVAIAALLMIIVGAFFYLTSAGNTSQLGTAKTIIWDALIGLFVAFFAWMVLYQINSDLVKIDLSSLSSLYSNSNSGNSTGTSASGSSSTPAAQQGPGNGKCQTVPSGPCSVENLKGSCMASGDEAKAKRISQLCNKESQGSASSRSGVDICSNYNNRSFSGGLFQINVFANGKLIDSKCGNLGSKGSCAPGKRRSSDNVCLGWNCQINNLATFDECMRLTFTGSVNIQAACKLSNNGNNLTPWACSANKCGLGGTSSSFCK